MENGGESEYDRCGGVNMTVEGRRWCTEAVADAMLY